jgi:hypothetical protein
MNISNNYNKSITYGIFLKATIILIVVVILCIIISVFMQTQSIMFFIILGSLVSFRLIYSLITKIKVMKDKEKNPIDYTVTELCKMSVDEIIVIINKTVKCDLCVLINHRTYHIGVKSTYNKVNRSLCPIYYIDSDIFNKEIFTYFINALPGGDEHISVAYINGIHPQEYLNQMLTKK